MESFFRYIAYVDYYKDGEKVRNVGFLRWKLYNNVHCVEIQLKDVGNFRGVYQIRDKITNKLIGEILLDKGIGSFINKFPAMSEDDVMYIEGEDSRIYLSDVNGFIIQLNTNEYLFVDLKLKQVQKHEEVAELEYEQKQEDIEAASENVLVEGIPEKYTESAYMQTIRIIEPLHDNKWQQLCKEYPKVHPFAGEKTFLTIKPEDFIILQQEYQKLVHNSFLLHGFYNYGHMILGKLSEEEEAPIYIGVPGVYYEREKQAARMFGFVGFESTEQPVQSGSYGYYMIEVKI